MTSPMGRLHHKGLWTAALKNARIKLEDMGNHLKRFRVLGFWFGRVSKLALLSSAGKITSWRVTMRTEFQLSGPRMDLIKKTRRSLSNNPGIVRVLISVASNQPLNSI